MSRRLPAEDAAPAPRRHGTFGAAVSLLFTRRFGTFWVASLLSSIGTWTQQVAEPWLLLTIGASSFMVGLDSFAATAPAWLLTLVGGALADRGDRRRIIAGFQSVQMLCPIAIVVLLATHRVEAWMVIALSVVVGVTDALSMPSFQSIVPTIVDHEDIASGLALNSTQFSLSRIIGPSIAGVLMTTVGLMACFAVSAASYWPFIGVALWILPRRAAPVRAESAARVHPLAALAHVLRQPVVRGALGAVLTTTMLCTPLVTFVPVLVRDGFHGGGAEFSAALASFGVGGLIGAFALLSIRPSVDRRRIAAVAAIGCGALVFGAGATPWLWTVPVLLAGAGAAIAITNTSANTIVQSTAAPGMLGQTVSLYMFTMNAGISIGALLTGAIVATAGIRAALMANGVMAAALHLANAVAWLRAPATDLTS
jgi:predicted MFS family arabinose efflux permease